MPLRFNEHPLRRALAAEVYARPFTRLQAPVRASHLALFTGEGDAEADRAHLAALCARFHAPVPAAGSNFLLADLGDLQVRWERHTEFVTYTFFVTERAPRSAGGAAERFRDTVIERVPRDWLETIPGEVIASLHLELERAADEALAHEDVPRVMPAEHFAGGRVGCREQGCCQAAFRRRRAAPPNATRPTPSSSRLAGSGTRALDSARAESSTVFHDAGVGKANQSKPSRTTLPAPKLAAKTLVRAPSE